MHPVSCATCTVSCELLEGSHHHTHHSPSLVATNNLPVMIICLVGCSHVNHSSSSICISKKIHVAAVFSPRMTSTQTPGWLMMKKAGAASLSSDRFVDRMECNQCSGALLFASSTAPR